MSDDYSSIISEYVSVNANELLSKVIKRLEEKRELLVFDEKDVFIGYLTQRYLVKQSQIKPDVKVSNLIKKVPTVSKNSTLDSIARAILSEKTQSVPVEDDGQIVGIFRDIDVIRLSAELFKTKKVEEFMTKNPISISPDSEVAKLITISRTNNISRVPVVDTNNNLIGIVSPHDVSKILDKFSKKAVSEILAITVDKVMTKDVVVCKKSELILEAISKLYKTDHKALVVVNNQNQPIGILTTTDLLETVSKPPQTEGYYIRVIGDVEEEDMDQVIEMGVELVKKFASIIGTSGQLYIHAKALPKKKLKGAILYQIRLRISTDKGKTYVAKSDGYGVFGAYAVAIDRLEREIISERELELQQRETGSERYLLEELEEL